MPVCSSVRDRIGMRRTNDQSSLNSVVATRTWVSSRRDGRWRWNSLFQRG